MNKYEAWLLDWFKNRTPHIELNPDENYFDAGVIDSFGVIELIEELENTYAVSFTQDDFLDRRFSSVSGLTELLTEKNSQS